MSKTSRRVAAMTERRAPCTVDYRAAGVLLHLTSLPGALGSGDLGDGARQFADFLHETRQRWWQMLPTGPIGAGNSPYSSNSAFAGGGHLIDLADLQRRGWLRKNEITPARGISAERVRYDKVLPMREAALRQAYERFQAQRKGKAALAQYREAQRGWLADFALFAALKQAHGGKAWVTWDRPLAQRKPAAIKEAERAQRDEIAFQIFVQWLFSEQWAAFKTYCNERGIGLVGDMPIFVTHDSADVWANRKLYLLDREGQPTVISGVPPDYFSKTGQRWGHPLYRWAAHREENFAWWAARFENLLTQFDLLRIDHFLGFHRLWNVPADAETAEHGTWTRTPGDSIFSAVRERLGKPQIIAEDLGLLIPEAAALRDRWGFPGMRVIQFAFDGARRYDQPHRYPRNCVAYTGTHDNTTTQAWFQQLPPKRDKVFNERSARERALAYAHGTVKTIHWDLLRALYACPANTVIAPMQDLLGLGAAARMNKPGTAAGNWTWRMHPRALSRRLVGDLAKLTITYEREGTWRGSHESEIS